MVVGQCHAPLCDVLVGGNGFGEGGLQWVRRGPLQENNGKKGVEKRVGAREGPFVLWESGAGVLSWNKWNFAVEHT